MLRNRILTWAAAGLAVALAAHGQATETPQTPPTPPAPTAPAAPAAALPSVDDVIAKNLAARGGKDQILAKKSVRMTGKMAGGGGQEFPFSLQWKRPNKMRLEFTFQGMTGIQAYDGTTGWMVMPFMGKKDPEEMSADDLKQVEDQADFDGELVNYKEKGHQVELVGKEPVEGTEAYKLKLTKKNGDVNYVYLDTESNLEFKREGKTKIRGQEVEFETAIGDYKEVAGLLLPHSIENKPKGAPHGQTLTIDKVEVDVDIPDTAFVMPAAQPAEEKKEGN
jgi:outer membrane lipoprotein-sorting protein